MITNRETLTLSTLPKTWLFDLDGVLVKYNGYKTDGVDSVLPGVKNYLKTIPKEDRIVIFRSRSDEYKDITLKFLEESGIRYDAIEFNMPAGERIVFNDRKLSGIDMAYAVNMDRDKFQAPEILREM